PPGIRIRWSLANADKNSGQQEHTQERSKGENCPQKIMLGSGLQGKDRRTRRKRIHQKLIPYSRTSRTAYPPSPFAPAPAPPPPEPQPTTLRIRPVTVEFGFPTFSTNTCMKPMMVMVGLP